MLYSYSLLVSAPRRQIRRWPHRTRVQRNNLHHTKCSPRLRWSGWHKAASHNIPAFVTLVLGLVYAIPPTTATHRPPSFPLRTDRCRICPQDGNPIRCGSHLPPSSCNDCAAVPGAVHTFCHPSAYLSRRAHELYGLILSLSQI